MAEINPNANYDAEQLNEEIKAGEKQAPSVDFDKDYELAKQFEVSEIDRTQAGSEAAAAATAHQIDLSSLSSEPEPTVAEPTGDPGDFLEMAKEVNPKP